MDIKTLFQAALALQAPWEVQDLRFDQENRLDIEIDFNRGATFACPVCGKQCKVHDTEMKSWRHLDFFQHSAYLTARVPRCHCDEHGIKRVEVPWARPGAGFTLLFESLVMMLARSMAVSNIAKLLGEHDTRIWRIIHHYVKDARKDLDMSEVTQIGVDETSAKRGHKYITLFMDMEDLRVLFGTTGKDSSTLKDFAEDLSQHGGYPENIEEISLDMSKAFIKGIEKHLPNAKKTFDRFHVMKLIGDAVDAVRRSEVKQHPELKGTRYCWLKNRSNLTAHQSKMLGQLRTANLKTAESYRMRLTFQDFYEQSNPKAAKHFLEEWCEMACQSGIEPMVKVAETIEAHAEGILRWFKSKLTNALLESINSLIQAAKARAKGFRNPQNLITIAYLIAGKLNFKLAPL